MSCNQHHRKLVGLASLAILGGLFLANPRGTFAHGRPGPGHRSIRTRAETSLLRRRSLEDTARRLARRASEHESSLGRAPSDDQARDAAFEAVRARLGRVVALEHRMRDLGSSAPRGHEHGEQDDLEPDLRVRGVLTAKGAALRSDLDMEAAAEREHAAELIRRHAPPRTEFEAQEPTLQRRVVGLRNVAGHRYRVAAQGYLRAGRWTDAMRAYRASVRARGGELDGEGLVVERAAQALQRLTEVLADWNPEDLDSHSRSSALGLELLDALAASARAPIFIEEPGVALVDLARKLSAAGQREAATEIATRLEAIATSLLEMRGPRLYAMDASWERLRRECASIRSSGANAEAMSIESARSRSLARSRARVWN